MKVIKNPALTKTEVIEIEPETVTITLSIEEAEMLLALSSHCHNFEGAWPAAAFNNAMHDAGVRQYKNWLVTANGERGPLLRVNKR